MIAQPRVAGFERLYSVETSDPIAGGELLLGELNCTSCHKLDKAWESQIQRKPAPVLDTVGSRVRPEYLLKFLADPQKIKPHTTMPNVLAGVPEAERAQQVEALVHFLATTGSLVEAAPLRQAVNRGETLFHTIGCVACHDPRQDKGVPPLASSIILGTPSRKYTLPGLTQFLADPLAIRPGGRMPHLNLTANDARDVASFLLNDLDIASGLQFAYYEGTWDKLPDFNKLKPTAVGDADNFDVTVAKRRDNFALRFDGEIKIDKAGDYLFLIGSDDGSRLWIDGKMILDNDGIHAYQQKRKKLKLTAGVHSVAVEYFEQGGEETLAVEFEGLSGTQQPLATLVSIPTKKDAPATLASPAAGSFEIKPELAAKGKELFATLGCASCHTLKQDGQAIASKLKAAPFAELKGTGGCLNNAAEKTPVYNLNARQQQSLSAALAAVKQPAKAITPQELVAREMVRFNCVACHARDGLGGVEDARNPHFKSDMPEMGDEGRLPPALTGVGAKLQSSWLKTLFDKGAKDRPYMFTRMPRFGSENVGDLITAFEQADAVAIKQVPVVNVDDKDKKFKAVGRRLVGSQGFSCIKCHTFADKKATGIQALSLTTMTQRLRPEWFHFYMLNPQVYRPGTRMPGAWPNGETQLPMVLDGSTAKQIRSIWAYLTDGDKATLPLGLVTGAIELIAFDEAIMYRNFIEGAGSRSIGVGYPEKLNLAFDANQDRLALIWHGAFMDANRHWNGRGTGFEPPLGDNVIKFADGASFAELADANAEWPKTPPKQAGYQFHGYHLGEARRPTFSYSFGNIQIQDYPAPFGDADAYVLRRTLTLTPDKGGPKPSERMFYRAAVGNKIEAGGGGYVVDEKLTLKLTSASKPVIRQSGGKSELLVPVAFDGSKAVIVQEYEW